MYLFSKVMFHLFCYALQHLAPEKYFNNVFQFDIKSEKFVCCFSFLFSLYFFYAIKFRKKKASNKVCFCRIVFYLYTNSVLYEIIQKDIARTNKSIIVLVFFIDMVVTQNHVASISR